MNAVFKTSQFLILSLSALSAAPLFAADPLPGTKPLTEEGNLAEKQVAGMHKYLDRALAASVEKRQEKWKADDTSEESYAKSVEPNRERFKKLIGVVDKRVPPNLELIGGPNQPALVSETNKYKVFAVRWAVLPGVDGEGLLLEPKGKAIGAVVALPDADQTPEQIVGLAPGVPKDCQFARLFAENGCRVLVPTLIDRKDDLSANPKLGRGSNQPHREFVYRMAYQMGRHVIGYEVQKVLAAVDWFAVESPRAMIGVVGYGEGGLIALYAAACDPRVGVCGTAGQFGPREGIAEEPIYRNVWGLLTEFGDAEVCRLLVPHPRFFHADNDKPVMGRALFLTSNCKVPEVSGPPAPRAGRGGAAPGALNRPPSDLWTAERKRIGGELTVGHSERGVKDEMDFGIVLSGTIDGLTNGKGKFEDGDLAVPKDARKDFDPSARHKRQFDQLVAYTQKLWRDSDATRKAYWAKADASSPEAWEKSCDAYRDYFHTEVIGKLPEPKVPLNPRSRQVYDEKTWAGYEVTLDCYEDVFATGILLLPKDLKPGEKRPVVVCQHGLEGTPRDTIEVEKRPVYNHFSRRLVELGYIVYAPQNPYYGKNVFRQLQRKANPLKLSLFSFIIRQHQRTLDWLETLPNVDPKKIAFYGLSYGGKTAMRVPAVEKRYCLSICSGDFNEWIGKNVSIDLDRSYMWTNEYEMYEFDLGNTFNYAEMAYLIAPRPFMVERGHDDGVGTDEMVASEYAKVRYLYANRLKLPERTTIEFFVGGHQVNAKETFAFLKKHLGYPK